MPACRPAEEIVAAQQVLWDLMAESCTLPLRAAAHLVSGGCSDDGFDYFRGWPIAQGREVFETMVADPDALAGPPLVQASAADGLDLEGEDVLGVAWTAHLMATGEQLPAGEFTFDTRNWTLPGTSTSTTGERRLAACPAWPLST
ncbi:MULTISPECIES: DUF4240 domain-containing protein [unclassified Streptomyces]|uniref:DUF4240 domain-containing protein n=1 Tax=unclassified Streptomyces TaxID=2593676 RepID=UPI001F341223|nr:MULTISPECIES: DUF4240 domain-containing protein [unclassified Streptomyces]